MRKYIFCLAVVTIIINSISCGKKVESLVSDTTDPGGPAVDPSVVISFIPAGSPSNNTVFLEEVSKNNNQITLAIKIKGGSNVFGAALEINYDSSLILFHTAAEGTYLKQDGNDTIFASSLNIDTSGNKQEGILLIGCNRKGNAPGANGDGVLATVVFRAKAKQTNTIIGFNAANCALTGSFPKYIAGTSWIGGNLSYQ